MIKLTEEGIEITDIIKCQFIALPVCDYKSDKDTLLIYKSSYTDCKIISDNELYLKIEDEEGSLDLYKILIDANEIDYDYIIELSDFTYGDYQDLSLEIELKHLTENEFYKTQYESFINDTDDFIFGKTKNMRRFFKYLSSKDGHFMKLLEEQKYKDLIIKFFELLDIILLGDDKSYRNLSDTFIIKELVKKLNLEINVTFNKNNETIEFRTPKTCKVITLSGNHIFTKKLRLNALDWIIRTFGNIPHSIFLILNDISPSVSSEKLTLGKVQTLEEYLDMLDLYEKYEGKIIY